MTESKGFGPVQIAGKWKRRYDGFAPEEPWFILTNLDSLDAAILAYQKRFSIEEMFRDLKSGGYSLENTFVEGKRFMTMVLLDLFKNKKIEQVSLFSAVTGWNLDILPPQPY